MQDWDIDTLDKHILNLIHNEPESATKLRGIEQARVHKNSKPVGSQRILNFVSGSSFDVKERPEKESIDITVPQSGGGGGGGIQFDTYPQAGDWLYIETANSIGAPNNYGFEFKDTGPGIWMHSAGNSTFESNAGLGLRSSNGNIGITALNAGANLDISIDTKVHSTSTQFFVDASGDIQLTSGHFMNIYGTTTIGLNSPGGIGIISPVINIGSGAIVYSNTVVPEVDLTATKIIQEAHGNLFLTAGTSGLTSPNGWLQLNAYDKIDMFCSIGDINIDVSNAGSPGDHFFRLTSNAASPHELFRVNSAGHVFIQHLPTSDPVTGDGQLWKNGNVVTVST